jgi:hypothetical protein
MSDSTQGGQVDATGASAPVRGRPEGDPITTKSRKATRSGGSDNCLQSNLTATGVSLLGIEPRDMLSVQVYPDGIWIEPMGMDSRFDVDASGDRDR